MTICLEIRGLVPGMIRLEHLGIDPPVLERWRGDHSFLHALHTLTYQHFHSCAALLSTASSLPSLSFGRGPLVRKSHNVILDTHFSTCKLLFSSLFSDQGYFLIPSSNPSSPDLASLLLDHPTHLPVRTRSLMLVCYPSLSSNSSSVDTFPQWHLPRLLPDVFCRNQSNPPFGAPNDQTR